MAIAADMVDFEKIIEIANTEVKRKVETYCNSWDEVNKWLNDVEAVLINAKKLGNADLLNVPDHKTGKAHNTVTKPLDLRSYVRPRSFLHPVDLPKQNASQSSSRMSVLRESLEKKTEPRPVRFSERLAQKKRSSNQCSGSTQSIEKVVMVTEVSDENCDHNMHKMETDQCNEISTTVNENVENTSDVPLNLHNTPDMIVRMELQHANQHNENYSFSSKTLQSEAEVIQYIINSDGQSSASHSKIRRSSINNGRVSLKITRSSVSNKSFRRSTIILSKNNSKLDSTQESTTYHSPVITSSKTGVYHDNTEAAGSQNADNENGYHDDNDEYSDVDESDVSFDLASAETPKKYFGTPLMMSTHSKFYGTPQKNASKLAYKSKAFGSVTSTPVRTAFAKCTSPIVTRSGMAVLKQKNWNSGRKFSKSKQSNSGLHKRSNSANCSSFTYASLVKSNLKQVNSASKDQVKLLEEQKRKEQRQEEARKNLEERKRYLEEKMQRAALNKKKVEELKQQEIMKKQIARKNREAEIKRKKQLEAEMRLAKQKEKEEAIRILEKENLKALNNYQNATLQQKAIINSALIYATKVHTSVPVLKDIGTMSNSSHNDGATKAIQAASLNADGPLDNTFVLNSPKESKQESYEMTPAPETALKKQMPSPIDENYNINDIKSDDETDDEENPRKPIPKWAKGFGLKMMLTRQERNPPDWDELFGVMFPPDPAKIFGKRKTHYKRTSSAIWNSPPMKRSSIKK